MTTTTPATPKQSWAAAVRLFTRQVRDQLSATTWPTRRATARHTGVVLAFLTGMVAVIGAADTALTWVAAHLFG